MAARGHCPECGSESLVEDAHYAQQQLVCAACGCVLSEGLLTTTYTDEEHLREVAYSQSTGQKEQLSRCLQRGIRRVQDLCKVLQLPAAFEETAVSHLQRALQLPAFQLGSLEKKEVLGGCCVLVACRQHGWPLPMGTLCSLLYARQDLFAGVYLSLQKELGLSVPALSLAELVTTHLNSFRLFQPTSNIPAAFLEDREQLLARTLGLVELASQAWLVTGRHPVPVVTASAFLAWQSLRPGPRLSCPLARFCRLAGVDLPPPAQLRLKELLEILQGMASQLPWLRGLRLDKRTVVKHVGELLQHRVFLLRKAFSQQDTAPGQGSPGQDTPCQGSPGQGSPGQGSPGQDTPCQDSPGQGFPCQGSPGQGSLDKDSLDKGSPGQGSHCQDAGGLGSLDQDSPDKDFLDKNSPGQDPPGQGALDKDSLDKGSPGQDPVGLGSLDQDSPGQDALNKDTLNKGSLNKDTLDKDPLNKGSLDKDSPDKDSSDKDSPGQNPVGLGSLNKDPLNKDSADKDSPGQASPGQGCPSQDPVGTGSLDQASPGQGCPSCPVAQEQGCPRAGKPQRGGSLRPLLPPCLLQPRKRLRGAAPRAPRAPSPTGDEPISDSEIEQYLRGPEEIQAFGKAKGWL